MADTSAERQNNLSALKVPELKKMLKARGLNVVGNKQELIDRLQSSEAAAEALLEGSEVGDIIDEELDRELDETALDDEPSKDVDEPLKDETEKPISESNSDVPKATELSTPKETANKKVDVTDKDKLNGSTAEKENKVQPEKHKRITISDVEVVDVAARKKARLERFGQSSKETTEKSNTADVLVKRAARFSGEGKNDKTPITPVVVNSQPKTLEVIKPTGGGSDKLKLRAERFGILSPAEMKKQQLEKLQARKARFAATPAVTTGSIKIATSLDEKKLLRAERFKSKS